MGKTIAKGLLALAFVSFEAMAQFCPGLSPWVFTDVPSNHPFCTDITWMAERGVTVGCASLNATQRLYCPDQSVRRDQMAAFMHRLADEAVFQQGGNAFGVAGELGTTDNQALEIIVNNSRVMRYEPGGFGPNMVGGHAANSVTPNEFASTIAGGGTAQSPNHAAGSFAAIGGGAKNLAGPGATVGGGTGNTASAQLSAIGGGTNNNATGLWSVVAGGNDNTASGTTSSVGGGSGNIAAGDRSTVAGGIDNAAFGYASFAAGLGARANHDGCFVYSDASSAINPTSCFAQNEIVIRGLGGFYFWTHGTSDVTYFGARLAPGTGAWATYSDRSSKELIDPVDPSGVLEKLVAIPISTWQWKSEPGGIRHMGPMAQDFRLAFGLGDSDKQIVTVDADGVALAAIQGLNAKLEREIAALKSELAALRRVVAR